MITDATVVTELAQILQPPGAARGNLRVLEMSHDYAADSDPAWMLLESYKGGLYIAKVWRAKVAAPPATKRRAKKKPPKKKPPKRGRK